MFCGRDWQPTLITRVVEPIRSSTCVVRVVTDAVPGFVKGMGNPQGNECLAQELVGSELAAALGLRVPPFAIVEVADLEIPMINGGTVGFGPAFISKALQGSPSDGAGTFLRRLVNEEDIALLVAFDTWVRNLDRCPPTDYLDPTPKWDNLFFTPIRRSFEMIVFDHTHCFAEADLETELAGNHFVEDARIFGAFPEFLPFLTEERLRSAAERIAHVDADAIIAIIQAVPVQWGPSSVTRARWAEQIFNRAARIEEYLFASLVPQLPMIY